MSFKGPPLLLLLLVLVIGVVLLFLTLVLCLRFALLLAPTSLLIVRGPIFADSTRAKDAAINGVHAHSVHLERCRISDCLVGRRRHARQRVGLVRLVTPRVLAAAGILVPRVARLEERRDRSLGLGKRRR